MNELSISTCKARYEAGLTVSVFRWDRFVKHSIQNFELFSERTSSLQRKVKLKDIANF